MQRNGERRPPFAAEQVLPPSLHANRSLVSGSWTIDATASSGACARPPQDTLHHVTGEPEATETVEGHMLDLFTLPQRAYLIEADDMPSWLQAELESSGVAEIASRTIEGLYVEPAHSLAAVLGVIERAEATVFSVRAMARTRAWERREAARPSRSRLRNPVSPCWLPTLARAS